MNIVVMGAGSIGSLFGGYLSKNNNVWLVGRYPHISVIKKSGLVIYNEEKYNVRLNAEELVDKITSFPDLLILTVKSYDTESAIIEAKKIITKDTIVLSLQNGLTNIEKIKKYIDSKKIIAGVTTHGALYYKPGFVKHTGKGATILGELNGQKTKRIVKIVNVFNKSRIETDVSNDIVKELWIKAIINSSINPLTTLFQCKNGYLLENPILENLVEKICFESTKIANSNKFKLDFDEMIDRTIEVIKNTSENKSSMLQSFNKNKKTEIESINGKLIEVGIKNNIDVPLNEMLNYSIDSLTK